jgi:hypothetical protein
VQDSEESITRNSHLVAVLKEVNTSAQVSSKEVNLASFTPKAILLDASSLEQVLRPVFSTYGQLSTTDSRYFLPDDKVKLGEFSYLSVPNLVNARIGGNVSLSQDYIFAMRMFAGRACTNLVNAEKGRLQDSNKLVKPYDWAQKKVSVEAISGLMGGVFGYTPAGGAPHRGAQELVTVFNDAVAKAMLPGSTRTPEAAMSDNYVLSCVYVVTDPRTYSR